MPLPSPRQGESRSDFVSRCMGNEVARREFPNQEQRAGMCYSRWRRSNNNNEAHPMMLMSVLNTSDEVKVHGHLTALQGEVTLTNVSRRQHLGEEHIVIPVVLMVEGVHCGSAGCAYYPAEELQKFPGAWNNRPVPIFHPEQDGSYVSCNDPEIIERQTVGQLFNVRYEHPRLVGEAWINRNRAQRIAPEVLTFINSNRLLEVSTGLFNDWELTEGTWNGEEYSMVVRNIRPDHLALLPGGVGACSVEDGCGAMRVNSADGLGTAVPIRKRGDGTMKDKDKTVSTPSAVNDDNQRGERDWVVLRRFMKSWLTDNEEQSRLTMVNEMGYTELGSRIQRKLDSMDDGERMHWLDELFANHFIYRVEVRGEVASNAGSDVLYYKRSYSVNQETREVNFADDATRVRKEVNYVPISAAVNVSQKTSATTGEAPNSKPAQGATAGGTTSPEVNYDTSEQTSNNNNEQEANNMERKQRIDALINNEKLPYKEEDRKMLMGLEDPCFEQTEATCNRMLEQAAETPPSTNEPSGDGGEPAQPQDLEEWLEQTKAPKEFKQMIRNSVQQYQQQREKKIDAIVSNSQFTKEELQAAEDRFIDRLYETVRKPVYMGGGGPAENPTGNKPFQDEEPLDLPSTNLKKEEKAE